MSYLDLVEDHDKNDTGLTQFEKIIVAAKRAKDLHNKGRLALLDSEHKNSYIALEELRDELINTIYKDDEPAALTAGDDEDEDEE